MISRDSFHTTGPMLLAPEWLMLPDGPHPDMAVLVQDGRFAAVGPLQEVQAAHPGLQPVVLAKHLLMPGLIDTHTHLTQSFGKALAFGEPSEIFRRIWVPMEQVLDADAAYLSAKLSAFESLRGGFTTVVDAGTRSEAGLEGVASAARDAGIRCVLGMICNDAAIEGDEAAARRILDGAAGFISRLEHDPLVHPSLAISIPEAATDRMLRDVAALTRESGRRFQTHVNEHLAAVERSLVARGLRPLELLHACGALNESALLAHATLLTPREIGLLRDSGAAVAYNPVASAWKGNAVLDAGLLGMLGVPFGLGTDGTRADGFRLMDAAEATQRLTHGLANGDSSCGGGWLWLDHATHLGASAAGLGTVTGAITTGLAADFLLVDLDVPEFMPSWDLSWELVRFGNRDQISAVFVNGSMRLWKGWPTDWDARALMREVAAVARRDVQRAPIQRVHPVADVHRARQQGA
ncbi:amidohydrolase family protein [Variovorax dokdonensis]|uniref:Amidohydrolase family protein n=1 Tax=Variovorax dokdonensis TaxID=344883 RepID=A0ABT7N547_9BURK|nr:amidohydrolase family protein [Variovorax dokdonensis]MDM0043043.1 amidohydrolase family protein [Variovorax dokdonensis]